MEQRPVSIRVALLVGSLRPDGYSVRLAEALTIMAPAAMSLAPTAIGDLQLYDPELEARVPPAYATFRAAILAASAVLFVTPEYNRSVPGVLKNALDVGSRPYGDNVFAGKPAAIASQSPGAMGGFGANHALRQSLVALDMPVMPQPEVYLGNSAELLGPNGAVFDEGTKCFLESFILAFARWIERFSDRRSSEAVRG